MSMEIGRPWTIEADICIIFSLIRQNTLTLFHEKKLIYLPNVLTGGGEKGSGKSWLQYKFF